MANFGGEESVINVTDDRTLKIQKRQSKIARYSRAGTSIPRPPPPKPKKKRDESIIEWFDRSVEDELQKRRVDSLAPDAELPEHSGMRHPHIIESTASGVDIQSVLRGERDTDLLDAVDKFAKAEAMVSFEGAVRAAEEAAASAPPELAEEAAVAGAKGYQAEVTSIVNEKVPGVRPIEVIGYVGITRPKFAKKR